VKVLCLALLTGLCACAEEMPTGYFRGAMLGWQGSAVAGVLSARAPSGAVYECRYDAKSYLELEKRRVSVDQLREGDPLEVLAHRRPGDSACYILSLEVVPPPAPARPARRQELTPAPPKPSPRAIPLRAQTFSGVVRQVEGGAVTVRTREGAQTFLLRYDTRFIGNGLRMEAGDLEVNQRVFVEAARNADGAWEAFQFSWGQLHGR
jgi:hypothetical protein